MTLRIGEVARRAGIAASAIRYYEKQGLIPVADRRGNARVYGPDILDRLALIELAKSAGFTIAETGRLLRGVSRRTPPAPRWRALAKQKLSEVEARIAEAERMRAVLHAVIRCECPSFEDCTRAGR
jgi:MerR family redox-sensitive transcriptional activator SoxR